MQHIELYDTTLRDGAQGEGVNFSLEDKVLIARRLDEMGFDYVEGAQEREAWLAARLTFSPINAILWSCSRFSFSQYGLVISLKA